MRSTLHAFTTRIPLIIQCIDLIISKPTTYNTPELLIRHECFSLSILPLKLKGLKLLPWKSLHVQHFIYPVENNGERSWFAHVLNAFYEPACHSQYSYYAVSWMNIPSLFDTPVLERNNHVVNWENLIVGTLQSVSMKKAEYNEI